MIQVMNWSSPFFWAGETYTHREAPRQAIAGVKFGQVSKNCQGGGLCEVELLPVGAGIFSPDNADDTLPCNKAITCILSVDIHNTSYLEMAIPTSSFNDQCRRKQLRREGFVVPEEYALHRDVCEALGLESGIVTKGLHPFKETIGMLIIRFTLKKEKG
jgi:hypothetical protein